MLTWNYQKRHSFKTGKGFRLERLWSEFYITHPSSCIFMRHSCINTTPWSTFSFVVCLFVEIKISLVPLHMAQWCVENPWGSGVIDAPLWVERCPPPNMFDALNYGICIKTKTRCCSLMFYQSTVSKALWYVSYFGSEYLKFNLDKRVCVLPQSEQQQK